MLELKDLTVGYGKKVVLQHVSVTIREGALTVLIGPNGSGKSTLLKAMLGLLPASGGKILLNGQSLTALSRKEIAQKIAFLPQSQRTPDMTVSQLVLHGRFPYLRYPSRYSARDREIARAMIEKMELSEQSESPLSTLSGGMKQNAYLAMALAQDTSLILLDEPTTYLDIAHQLKLMQALKALASEGRGIVCVMHDLPLSLNFADMVIVLCDQGIKMADTPEKVCASGILEQIFGVAVESQENHYRYRYPTF